MNTKEIEIRTPRTLLKRMSMQEAKALFAYRSLPDVYVFHAWNPGTVEEAGAFIRKHSMESSAGVGEWMQLGVYARSGGLLIGDCGFFRPQIEEAEIGYTVAPDHQGKGIATEVVRALVDFLLEALPVQRIVARTDPDNKGSIRVLEHLDFRLVSHLVKSVQIRGEWKDDLVFCLRRD